jgi:drug/metabolite transporter (DMT)-like permease
MSIAPPFSLAHLSPLAKGRLAALVTVAIWTSFIVVARASADPDRGGLLTPFDIVYARIWGAALILLPWGWWLTHRDRRPGVGGNQGGTGVPASSFWGFSPLPLRQTVTAGLFGGLLYALLSYSGFVFAPAAHASVLMPGSLPLWTSLLAMALLHDRITPARAIGLTLIVAGDLLVGGASLLHALDGSGVWRGDLLFIAAAVAWSVYSVLVRRFALNAVRATIAITVFAFFCYVPVYTLLLLTQATMGHVLQAPWQTLIFQMLFQGVGSVVLSGISFNKMIQYFGPVRSTMITASVPGLSALASVGFLDEPLQWNLLGGLALVTAGIVFGVRRAALPAPLAGLAPGLPRT